MGDTLLADLRRVKGYDYSKRVPNCAAMRGHDLKSHRPFVSDCAASQLEASGFASLTLLTPVFFTVTVYFSVVGADASTAPLS